jgi:hypothetical protein
MTKPKRKPKAREKGPAASASAVNLQEKINQSQGKPSNACSEHATGKF